MRRTLLYTINQLYELKEKPKINEISLKILQEYSLSYLEPYEFRFLLDDENSTMINLRFPQDRIPHLFGVETVAKKGGIPQRDLGNFRGQTAYNRIEIGDLTFDILKSIHKPTFKSIKDKLIYFYQLPHLVMSSKIVFNFTKVEGSNIECELLMYNEMHGVYAHLGLEKETSGVFYIARTFFIERNLGSKFIDAQKEKDKNIISSIHKVSLSNGLILATTNFKNEF